MRGEIAFEPALRERVALLGGLPASVIDEALRDRITLNPGARTLVRTMRARGARIAIVSGGFRRSPAPSRNGSAADEDRANELAVADGRLTGKVVEPVLGLDAKLAALSEIAAAMRLSMAETPRSATAPTIWRCSRLPASASPIAPSRRWPPQPPRGSTTAT